MHLIVCVDDEYGLSFCGRRLSRDKEVYAHILRLSSGHLLWTAPNSAGLFPDGSVVTDINFMQRASRGEYCFAETLSAVDSVQNLETVVLYHWNRRYPSTEKLPKIVLEKRNLMRTEEFKGNSHDKITMERYSL